ncbi:MAG: ribonuclease P protein component [Patescibacteria group bacterium]|nr:ribonuclease P protein component [Patescibacteria group bacterium]MDE2438503.1 ribonuclease P protein component [Patescibacteria group bacterium]
MEKKIQRLLRNDGVKKVFVSGKRVSSPFFALYIKENNLMCTRATVVVGAKINKKAVERNYIKRAMRGVMEELRPSLVMGYDIVIRVTSSVVYTMKHEKRRQELTTLFRRAKLLV